MKLRHNLHLDDCLSKPMDDDVNNYGTQSGIKLKNGRNLSRIHLVDFVNIILCSVY